MKTALEIISKLVSSLTDLFTSKKPCSSKETPVSEPKAPEQEKQPPEPEIKPSAKVEVDTEPTVVKSQVTDTVVASSPEPKSDEQPIINVEASAKPQAKEPAPYEESNRSELPQDSILKRHYLTHVLTMVEALAPQCPTDSVLSRHHYTMLAAKLDQCLNDKKAMEQLICDYESLRS